VTARRWVPLAIPGAERGDIFRRMPGTTDSSAQRALDRLTALSDGVFAIAMTLLVLDLRVPALEVFHAQAPLWTSGAAGTEHVLLEALVALAPRLVTYLLSFITLGIFWLAQQAQLELCEGADRRFAWWQLGYLCAVTAMPFSTSLLAEYITFRVAVVVYWLNLVALGAVLLCSWRYARRHDLLQVSLPAERDRAITRRIVVYQSLYAASALLCVVSTYLSVALLVLLQLNSVIAPRVVPATSEKS
jgi:uncharacterized membrane protein